MATTATPKKIAAAKKAPAAKKVSAKDQAAAHLAGDLAKATAKKAAKPVAELRNVGGFRHCPGCNIDLHNGVGEHNQEVNGKYIKHDQFQYACLGCGAEFGPAIKRKAATKGNTGNKGVHLTPELIKGKEAAVAAAKAKGRKRPVLARRQDGSEVLCCSRTAKKNGWTLVERLFSRTAAPAPEVKTPAAKRAKRLENLDDLLGKK